MEERPVSLWLTSIDFKDGTKLQLGPGDITVFVGPNNVGKSAVLKEIHRHLSEGKQPSNLVEGISFDRRGSREQLEKLLADVSAKKHVGSSLQYVGSGYNIQSNIIGTWDGSPRRLVSFFCKLVGADTRLTGSNPTESIRHDEPATNPIQLLFAKPDLELRLSKLFEQAFSSALIVYRMGGPEIPLFVGKRAAHKRGEALFESAYVQRFEQLASPLKSQGDGMRSFATILLEAVAGAEGKIVLLDEPEAFLHPPQARLIGRTLAKQSSDISQLFISTHSIDVLLGILGAAPRRLNIVRLNRDANLTRVSILEPDQAQRIANDPLLKYSSLLSALFYKRAAICEGDSDCLFYQAVLDQTHGSERENSDILFLHASGKDRMAAMARSLRALDVQVDVIADADILRGASLEKLSIAVGADWNEIEPYWKLVSNAIESRKPWSTAGAIHAEISEILGKVAHQTELPSAIVEEIKGVLKKASPWDAVKAAGDRVLPKGPVYQAMGQLRQILAAHGVHILSVGELEGFNKNIVLHGPKWAQAVVEKCDLVADPELAEARAFVASIWGAQPSIQVKVSARRLLRKVGVRKTTHLSRKSPD